MSDQPTYRGNDKHKNRPAFGRKGTICPDWTHSTAQGGLGASSAQHEWPQTEAARLFAESDVDPDGAAQRYATSRGIAFCAQPSNDGTWHGYPVPWQSVPTQLTRKWLQDGRVTKRDVKLHKDHPADDIYWALESDDD